MAKKITIWALNKASDLLALTDTDKKQILRIFGSNKIQFGTRGQFDGTADKSCNLMPDKEYSVPILVKCAGDYLDKAEQYPLLSKISRYYKSCRQDVYTSFWKDHGHRDYKMNTKKYMGYYSILEQTAPNILVGYSLGGLVAKYLDFLDRNIFNPDQEKEIIKGVITISSPNFGSPLANCENRDSILKGIAEILNILGLDEKIMEISLEVVFISLRLIIDILKEFKCEQTVIDVLSSLYDWLGGLRDDPNNAFYDLNLLRLEPSYPKNGAEFSVLASINNHTGTYTISDQHRGVISSDNNLVDLLGSIGEEILYYLIHRLLDKLSDQKIITRDQKERLKEQASLPYYQDNRNRIIAEIEEVYNSRIMNESYKGEITNPQVRTVIGYYENGMGSLKLNPRAHDFIVPSPFQLTMDGKQETSSHNLVDTKANHLSGAEPYFKAGRRNRNSIITYLKEIIG